MTRKAILQIGTEKTGTTTLQCFLAANRAALAERGVLYPRFPGDFNHTGLAAYAMEADRPDPLKAPFGGHGPETVAQMRAQLTRLAEAELTGPQDAIFCSEHCHSRLVTRSEVQRLYDLLSGFFDQIEVAVYLRRQDRVALSLYSTQLKSGDTPAEILPGVTEQSPYYNYDRFLGLWEEVFGRDHIHVRLFEREALVNGSVVDDFLASWGLGVAGEYRAVENENSAITSAAQDFLARLNPHLAPRDGRGADPLRGIVVSALEGQHAGPGARPSRDAARGFYDRFRASNARVAARYFPGRDPLFSEDFSSYPEVADPRAAAPDALMAIAADVLRRAGARIDVLEAEISIREAALSWQREPEAGLARLRAAIAAYPDHAGLYRTLGEFMLRLERPGAAVAAAEAAVERAPDNTEYLHFLGYARAMAGDDAGAVEAQSRVLALDPSHASAATARARAEARLAEAARKQA